jgi:hypothetical protein
MKIEPFMTNHVSFCFFACFFKLIKLLGKKNLFESSIMPLHFVFLAFFLKITYFIIITYFCLQDWGLNSKLHTLKVGTLLSEPHLPSILLWIFCRWGLVNCSPKLASGCGPSDLSLPSS